MTKSELRKIYVEKRRSLSAADRAAASSEIANMFFNSFDVNAIRFLHCFISIENLNELDTAPIFERIWANFPQIRTVVPHVNSVSGEIESLTYSPETEMGTGRWHIREPVHDEIIGPERLDIVLVPLLCFDRSGHRVGYGKGYYDRFLKRCRVGCLKIGLSFFVPVDRISDAHAGDVQLDFAVTPSRVYQAEI